MKTNLLRFLLQALALRHGVAQSGSALLHTLFQRGRGLLAFCQLRLGLAVELGILHGQGRVHSESPQDRLVMVETPTSGRGP